MSELLEKVRQREWFYTFDLPDGTHDDLVSDPESPYTRAWRLQKAADALDATQDATGTSDGGAHG